MDYGKWIVQLFGERCTKESRHHDRDSEPEWCDRCFAYAQHDEIERLREALESIRKELKAVCGDWREVSCIIDDIARSALQPEEK